MATVKEWQRVIRPVSFALHAARQLGPKQARIRTGFDLSVMNLDHRHHNKVLKTGIDSEFCGN